VVAFEKQRVPGPNTGTLAKALFGQLLLSEDIPYEDVPNVLQCFCWIRSHQMETCAQISPKLRAFCNARQRRVLLTFDRLSAIKNNTTLVQELRGKDPYDDSLRLCTFLEIWVERGGPFGVLALLNRVNNGRKAMKYAAAKFDHLSKAAPDTMSDLLATIVHSLGQRLAHAGCTARQMHRSPDARCSGCDLSQFSIR